VIFGSTRGAELTGRDSGAVVACGMWCATGRQDVEEMTGCEVNDETPGLALSGG